MSRWVQGAAINPDGGSDRAPLWGTYVGPASAFLGMDVSVSVTQGTPV